jgi:hypothetical protein
MMKIYMNEKEINLYKNYLTKPNIRNYLEFGSGGSTLYASNINQIEKIITIETDKRWIDKITNSLDNNKVEFKYCDIDCIWWEYVTWANEKKKIMADKSTLEKWEMYSSIINKLNIVPDIVLIDGRFRVASCLEVIKLCTENTYILFHDYTIREQYHIVELFLDKIESIDSLQVSKIKQKIDFEKLNFIINIYRLIID